MADTEPQEKKTPSRSFRCFIWDTDTHLKTPEERKLLRKLDWSILTIGCLGFFMKYLDQGNLANAYVSGMQEDLAMYGNEYTYAQTAYTCAYAIMQVPSTLIVQKIRPSIWLVIMEVGWGVWTFAQAGMHNVGELYAFRFLVGLFESSFFPVLLYVLGSWYTKTELAKRVALFHVTAPLGSAFGGYLQAAVYESLNGRHGLAGWRWLYIICGCMTVPVGIATYFVLPDTPYTTKARFLTPAECELAISRVQKAGKAPPKGVDLQTFKRVLSKWRWYAFVPGYVLYGESCKAGGYFGIWLKSEHFSVVDRNVIPTGSKLISAACIILWGFLSDYTGSRFALILGPLLLGLIPNGILAVWPRSVPLKEFAFLTSSVHLMTAVFYTWANEVCAGDNEERALVISSMNGMQYAFDAWLPIVIFPQTMAPTFRYGFPATFGFVFAAIIAVIIIRLLVWRESKNRLNSSDDSGEGGVVELVSPDEKGSVEEKKVDEK
ncbi:pantothenate transporter liz1 [Diaporthe eres]|uniref:Major facilitator superfamily (MFS) profile domain-containing protein n=1 Tax=Diaporthe vaccinii TaxID=105482 RepID=A0ABR4EFB8_9PEZI|nr:pantothenate transporter liz1 [Diaporthe eres]